MVEFLVALAAFLLSHSIPARPRLRRRLVGLLGERGYVGAYSLLSLALLAWLIGAALRAPYIPLWDKRVGQYWAPIVAMPPAFVLLASALFCANPLSIGFNGGRFDPERPGIVAVTRHPLLWAFALWAFAHVVPNGDVVGVIMFGGFGLFAFLAMPLIDRRKRRAMGGEWHILAARTSILPFAAAIKGRTPLRWRADQLLGTLVVGLLFYVVMLWAHPYLFGPDPKLAFG